MVQLGLGFSDGESLFHVVVVVNIYVLVYFGSVLFWSLVSDNNAVCNLLLLYLDLNDL